MALDNTAAAADGGALTVEQSIADQMERFDENETQTVETPEGDPVETDTPAEPAADDVAEVETPDGDEEAEGSEAQTAPIEPPQFWTAEAKARFRDVPRDVQEIILAQEQTRNAFTSKAAQEANETRKAAEAERTKLVQFNEQLAKFVPEAEKTFADRWANVDWVQLTEQLGAEQATKLKFQHDADQTALARLQQAQALTQRAAFEDFVKQEAAVLPTICPDLVDVKEGPARRQALGKYLVEEIGISPQAVTGASAKELTIAYKAMQWDRAQAKAKSLANKPKQPATPQQPQRPAPSRPGSTVAASSTATAALTEAQRAFDANPSMDNSVKLQLAQQRVRKK